MRYYALRDENGRLLSVGMTSSTGVSGGISRQEYDALREEISRKALLTAQLYAGEITAGDVPAEWREEINARVERRIGSAAEPDAQEVDGECLMNMILEVL